MKSLKIDLIQIGDMQARVRTDSTTVDEYAEAWKEGVKLPPVTVFHDGKAYYLADGVHRVLAAMRAGLKDVPAEIQKGGRKEALWFAAGSNIGHGLKRTNADKIRAVEIALQLKPNASDRDIAAHVGVSHHTVAKVRQVGKCPPVPTGTLSPRIGKDGKNYPPQPPMVPDPGPTPTEPPQDEDEPPRVQAGPPPSTPPPPPAPPEPEPVKDKLGRPIPEHLVPLWDRAREVQDGLTAISRVKCALEESQDQDDPLYAEVNHSATIAALNQAYTSLKTALPYTVCPSCQGAEQVSKSCRLCKGRGFVSEFRWDRAVPKETKTLILNTVAKGRWDKLKAKA